MADPIDDDPRSIEDRAEDEGAPEELFPLGSLQGDELTPQKLIKRGLPVEVTVAMGTAEVPVQGGGLLDPDRAGRVLVSYEFAKNVEVPQREDGRIVGWKVRQMLRPTYVQQAKDEGALIREEFAHLLALDQKAAGALLDDLGAAFARASMGE